MKRFTDEEKEVIDQFVEAGFEQGYMRLKQFDNLLKFQVCFWGVWTTLFFIIMDDVANDSRT